MSASSGCALLALTSSSLAGDGSGDVAVPSHVSRLARMPGDVHVNRRSAHLGIVGASVEDARSALEAVVPVTGIRFSIATGELDVCATLHGARCGTEASEHAARSFQSRRP